MKRILTISLTVLLSTALCVGVVYAASLRNITSTLNGADGDTFQLDGTLTVKSLKIGQQSIGGVTFFNGTIVNNTTNAAGTDNPVTFGDNVRIDGAIHRGTTAGTGDSQPVKINDDARIYGNLSLDGSLTIADNQTLTLGTSSVVNLTGAAIQGLSSEDLSDGSHLTKDNSAATLSADWVNTAYPWSADEVADTTRTIPFSLAALYTDADGTPAAITSLSTPALNYTANQGLFLQYAEDDTVDFGGQIIVPDDYVSGGVLKAVVDTSGNLVTDWNLDFKVAISETAGTPAWATAMANETPVDIPDNAGTPDIITFTPASQSDISAGDVIFFDISPDSNTATGEPNLEIYSLWFEYTATQ
jgi:hypothetical protein